MDLLDGGCFSYNGMECGAALFSSFGTISDWNLLTFSSVDLAGAQLGSRIYFESRRLFVPVSWMAIEFC